MEHSSCPFLETLQIVLLAVFLDLMQMFALPTNGPFSFSVIIICRNDCVLR